MITFDHSPTGSTIARAMAEAPDTAAEFFRALITEADDDFPGWVARHLKRTERQEVAAFLILMAEKIGGAA